MATNKELLKTVKNRREIIRKSLAVKDSDPGEYRRLQSEAKRLLIKMRSFKVENPASYAIDVIGL
jgi:hypothetical protein